MSVILSITSRDLDEDVISDLTRNLCIKLIRETEVDARLDEGSSQIGAKGEPIALGTIILTALTSGAIVPLINVLKSYFERDSSLEIELQRGDGKKLRFRMENLRPNQIEHTLELSHKFLKDVE